jgi:hypothetical protein
MKERLGEDIHKLLKGKVVLNNDLYRIFDKNIKCGPLDGGCHVMARALQKAIGKGELYAVFDKGLSYQLNPYAPDPHHVVLKVNDEYIDADGISSKKQLLTRWEKVEGLKSPFLRKFHPEYCKEYPKDKVLESHVVNYLSGIPIEELGYKGKTRKQKGAWSVKYAPMPLQRTAVSHRKVKGQSSIKVGRVK